jgi:hypothetical protein
MGLNRKSYGRRGGPGEDPTRDTAGRPPQRDGPQCGAAIRETGPRGPFSSRHRRAAADAAAHARSSEAGTPGRVRTYSLRLRRPTLYPVELRAPRRRGGPGGRLDGSLAQGRMARRGKGHADPTTLSVRAMPAPRWFAVQLVPERVSTAFPQMMVPRVGTPDSHAAGSGGCRVGGELPGSRPAVGVTRSAARSSGPRGRRVRRGRGQR